MAVATRGTAGNDLQRTPSPSSLADVVDLILDKGLVIDAYLQVSVTFELTTASALSCGVPTLFGGMIAA